MRNRPPEGLFVLPDLDLSRLARRRQDEERVPQDRRWSSRSFGRRKVRPTEKPGSTASRNIGEARAGVACRLSSGSTVMTTVEIPIISMARWTDTTARWQSRHPPVRMTVRPDFIDRSRQRRDRVLSNLRELLREPRRKVRRGSAADHAFGRELAQAVDRKHAVQVGVDAFVGVVLVGVSQVRSRGVSGDRPERIVSRGFEGRIVRVVDASGRDQAHPRGAERLRERRVGDAVTRQLERRRIFRPAAAARARRSLTRGDRGPP